MKSALVLGAVSLCILAGCSSGSKLDDAPVYLTARRAQSQLTLQDPTGQAPNATTPQGANPGAGSGAGTVAAVAGTTPNVQVNTPAAKRVPPRIDVAPITGYVDLDREIGAISFENAYTRIVVRSELWEFSGASAGESDEVQPLPYSRRGWMERYLVAQKDDMNLSVKVRIGDYDETVPLAIIGANSDRNGEAWSRELTHDAASFPWFLVRAGGAGVVPRVVTEFNGSRAWESGVAATALQVALGAIKIMSPQATVITTLSAPATRDKANAIDQVISKLFSSRLVERHASDRSLARWSPTGGLNIKLNIPLRGADWNGDVGTVGGWTISFEAPRPSLFSDWYLCSPEVATKRCKATLSTAAAEALNKPSASAILAYPLLRTAGSELTIKSYLLQQSWYASAQSAFSGNQQSDAWIAHGLCLSIADSVIALGLNYIDATLVTWAAMEGMQHSKVAHALAWKNAPACLAASGKIT